MSSTLQSGRGVARLLVQEFACDKPTAQEAYDTLYGKMSVEEHRAKMVPQAKYLTEMLDALDISPEWLTNTPHLGAKLTKTQKILTLVAARATGEDTPLISWELRNRLSKVVTLSLRLKEEARAGDVAMDVDTPKKDVPATPSGSRGTKRNAPDVAESPSKARHISGDAPRDDWRARAEALSTPEVIRKVRELVARDDRPDSPEARLLNTLLALRAQLFSFEVQIDAISDVRRHVLREQDETTAELRVFISNHSRTTATSTKLIDTPSPPSNTRTANAPIETKAPVASSGPPGGFRATMGPGPAKVTRSSRSRPDGPVKSKEDRRELSKREDPKREGSRRDDAKREDVRPRRNDSKREDSKREGTKREESKRDEPKREESQREETKDEEPVSSRLREKGKQRAAPAPVEKLEPAPEERTEQVPLSWAEDYEADRAARMVVSDGDGEDRVDYSDDGEMSDVSRGYRSDN
ncbi:hypothetical protein DFP72DRAFT_1084364 [Ephemerocybe angulata]|uniref:Uncharacterized protein n=1 Tax=Ephemerocybe angulata TaxID=980116 RepID=A0A8H6H6H0_9AGAR|nr:hypothetical protein DFP72DRAFT_1084364 [Tulosesus angulatus]